MVGLNLFCAIYKITGMPKKLNIAIVDDDEIYSYIILRTLQASEISKRNMVFINGEQALHFIVKNMNNESELPDVILLDMNMPKMDGFDFIKEYVKLVPQITKKTSVFMISSSINPLDIERARGTPGIMEYISKPIIPDRLIRTITELHLHL